MPSRFTPGSAVYTKDGRHYVVDEAVHGMVYCTATGGAETEFPESQLMTEAEWAARTGGRREMLYSRLKQSRAFMPPKTVIDHAGAVRTLARVEQLFPGLLDFIAFTAASRMLTESGDQALVAELSIAKCRAVFDAATPEVRANLLAEAISTTPATLISASSLGENMARAMIEKGLDTAAFDAFGSRRRN
ncbi:MAG TPA: hypothetical protein VL899_09785 [Alphaproteobacteria bacterium]|jgi:hypothetical protein|nr:hypothetical protein [Alphaproteobacteria bacterium]